MQVVFQISLDRKAVLGCPFSPAIPLLAAQPVIQTKPLGRPLFERLLLSLQYHRVQDIHLLGVIAISLPCTCT
jgi:hypothetical protein